MLYQTQQHTLTTPPSTCPTSPLPFFSISMELVENALKGSFINQMSCKLPLIDDLHNAPNSTAVASDEFSVDDLLDFSKINGCDGIENQNESPTVNDVSVNAIHTPTTNAKEEETEADRNGVVVEKEASDICVPTDDVQYLEWLSHFVEDSFTEYSLTCALPVKPTTTTAEMLPVEEASEKPTKARSKRVRNGVLGWSFSGSETTLSTSSSSSTTSASSDSSWLIYSNQPTNNNDTSFDSSSKSPALMTCHPPQTTETMKRRNFSKPSAGNKTAQIRRCSHCGVQKTPQWRAGPLGAKTLCNACGVRFKSGRLFPEYRPACSPTFSSKLHSNNHRRVLEMRHKKEVKLPESGRVSAVSSY